MRLLQLLRRRLLRKNRLVSWLKNSFFAYSASGQAEDGVDGSSSVAEPVRAAPDTKKEDAIVFAIILLCKVIASAYSRNISIVKGEAFVVICQGFEEFNMFAIKIGM